MEKRKIHLIGALVSGLFILLADQIAKKNVLNSPDFSSYLIKPYLGWELFLNPGVAFGIPLPNWLIVIITPFIVLTLSLWLAKKYQQPKTQPIVYYGLSFIILCALSNYIDRVLTAHTIDYIRIFHSVINLADVGIAAGVLLLFLPEKTLDQK